MPRISSTHALIMPSLSPWTGYTRHLKIDETVFNALKKAGGQLVFKTVEDPLCDPNKLDNHPYGIKIIKYALINPLNL